MHEELRAVGLLDTEGRLAEPVAPTAAAIAEPTCTAELLRIGRAEVVIADVWIGSRRAVVHQRGDAVRPVVSVGSGLLPTLVARTLHLGPRPAPPTPPFDTLASTVADACLGRGSRGVR